MCDVKIDDVVKSIIGCVYNESDTIESIQEKLKILESYKGDINVKNEINRINRIIKMMNKRSNMKFIKGKNYKTLNQVYEMKVYWHCEDMCIGELWNHIIPTEPPEDVLDLLEQAFGKIKFSKLVKSKNNIDPSLYVEFEDMKPMTWVPMRHPVMGKVNDPDDIENIADVKDSYLYRTHKYD